MRGADVHRRDECFAGGGRGAARERGFTLIEILLAVTLLALLIATGFATLRTAARATRSGEALIDATDRTRVTQEFLRRQLSHAMPLPFERLEDRGENGVFVAERDILRFVAPMPGHLSRGGPHVQWLTIESGPEGRQLSFDHAQLNGYDVDDPKQGNPRKPVVLMEEIEDAHFEFRALDESGELTDWMDSWDDPQRLPLMVRLVVEFERDSRRRWPDLDIPLLSATATPGFFNLGRSPGALPGGETPRPTPPGDGGGE